MTHYLILARSKEGGWQELAGGDARSATAAIRDLLDGRKSDYSEYVAVPARSWKPVTVKVETKTTLRFE